MTALDTEAIRKVVDTARAIGGCHCAELSDTVDTCLDEIDRLRFELEEAQDQVAVLKIANDSFADVQADREDLQYFLEQINSRVMPGTTDSIDALREIIREREELLKDIRTIAFIAIAKQFNPMGSRMREVGEICLKWTGGGQHTNKALGQKEEK